MGFVVLPALDVADGRAAATAAAPASPLDIALAWQAQGAEWVHIVDLDAARGRGSNAELLAAIVGALDVPVQLSGGIRDGVSLAWALSTGCGRAVLASDALDDEAWCARAIAEHGERIAVALDVDGTRLRDRGTGRDVGVLAHALARLDDAGCARYVVTDIQRDGQLRGPNLALYRAITTATTTPVTASGGMASLDDLVALAAIAPALDSAVMGHALHAGHVRLPDALAAVRLMG